MTPADLKDRIDLVALVGESEPLKPQGRKFRGTEHESLWVDPDRGYWARYSQPGDHGRKFLDGDAYDWLSYQRFGHTRAEGPDFVEVLRDACEFAGVDFDQEFGDDAHAKAAADRREREGTLAAYVDLAVSCWTGEARERARVLKPYLTDEVLDRWRIGMAPSEAQMVKAREAGAAELTDERLLAVGLLRKGDRPALRAFFWDCMVIPCLERGSVVYLSSRRLVRAPENGPKAKHLPTPTRGADGRWVGGMPRPAGFNVDAARIVQGAPVFLVEGPLDAIACTERGFPAVAMFGKTPSDALCAILKRRGW